MIESPGASQPDRDLGYPTATASRARGRKGGCKREFSPAVRKAQERYDKRDLSVTEIVRLAGVSRQTLYRYLERISEESPSN